MDHLKELVGELKEKMLRARVKKQVAKEVAKMTPPKAKYCYRYNQEMLEQCEVCEYCPGPEDEGDDEKEEENRIFKITHRSNVVQLDDMGYPLRLCIVEYPNKKSDQVWIDTVDREGDVVLVWEECIKNKKERK